MFALKVSGVLVSLATLGLVALMWTGESPLSIALGVAIVVAALPTVGFLFGMASIIEELAGIRDDLTGGAPAPARVPLDPIARMGAQLDQER